LEGGANGAFSGVLKKKNEWMVNMAEKTEEKKRTKRRQYQRSEKEKTCRRKNMYLGRNAIQWGSWTIDKGT
jgi:hypothetical protein